MASTDANIVANTPPTSPASLESPPNPNLTLNLNSQDRFDHQKEKIKNQMRFFENVTLADVKIDQENMVSLTLHSTTRTMVQSIRGIEPSKIGAKVLRQICVILKLQNYSSKSKAVLLDMIGERKKKELLEIKIYSDDFDESVANDGVKKPAKQRKGTKPKEIQEDGSLYRLMLTFFLQKYRHLVTQLGTNPTAAQLGSNKFLHERIFYMLADSYNDATDPSYL